MMSKRKILIVDDEKGFTSMLSMNLKSTGNYDVEVENNSNHAFSTALRYRPDLVLLDIIMPEKEGTDVLIDMRNNEILKKIPAIFLTATVTEDEVLNNKGIIGGHSFLAKPSRLEVLLDSIEKNLVND